MPKKSVSTLQLAVMVSCVGSLAAVLVPSFVRNLHASRLAEPLSGLKHLSAHATMQAACNPTRFAYPATVGRTPEQVPAGEARKDPPGTWTHPTWRMLGFEKSEPHYYSFEFESQHGDTGAHFVARAFGDLDGDGELSRFELYGESQDGREPLTFSVRMDREYE